MLFTDISCERVIRAFKKVGFEIIKQGKHTSMAKEKHIITIPRHKRLNPYTLKTIIKRAGLTDEEFKELL
ncbi:MAG: type II toxin-antitoxin system HicA family toxin [Elusimicrobiota bacterium]